MQVERDYLSASGYLYFSRTYNSSDGGLGAFASGWSASYLSSVDLWPSGDVAVVTRPDGRQLTYTKVSSVWHAQNATSAALQEKLDSSGGRIGWIYRLPNGIAEEYHKDGRLSAIIRPSGLRLTMEHDANSRLSKVLDPFGRSLQFSYDGVGRINGVTDPAGATISYQFDAQNNVSRATVQDGAFRVYRYTNSTHPHALTGLDDEIGAIYAKWGYDAQGRAISSQHANSIDLTELTFNADGSTTVVDALGAARRYWHVAAKGIAKPTGVDQPGGAGCAASTSSTLYDASGNPEQVDDFNGTRACRAYDARNLELARVEGLPASQSCAPVVNPGATIPAGSRKKSTQWHPDFRFETKLAEAGRITTLVYNGQPDPLNSGQVASCAPTSAVLTDDKPIAVLCKKVEQATTDPDGAQGFSATIDSAVSARNWQWTYNEHGQVLTVRDPMGNQTANDYYTSTSADYTKGDLHTSTNAAGHVTQYPRYNKHGQVLQRIDANGVVTDYTYDLRQRLKSVTTLGQTTSYDYDAAGQLKKVSQPDGTFVAYDYDEAHRLVAVSDSAGNRIEYTLDNAGNRTAEKVKDPSGALKRQITRAMDALGRVEQTTGR